MACIQLRYAMLPWTSGRYSAMRVSCDDDGRVGCGGREGRWKDLVKVQACRLEMAV